MSSPSPQWAGRWALPLNELALVLAIVLVFVATGLLDRNHTYFTNFESSFVIILRNTVLLGIIALGAAVVIISGGIDLSAGSMVAFSATTTALIGAIVGEWFGDNNGIGTLILHALQTEDIVRLWCGIVACAAIGAVFYGAVAVVERRLLWWPAPALDT